MTASCLHIYFIMFLDGYTGAYNRLSPRPPPISLLSITPLLSIAAQMAIIISAQVVMWFLLKKQSWLVFCFVLFI